MKLTWLNNNFICKDLYSPFKIDKDSDYIKDLKNKYDIVMKQAINSVPMMKVWELSLVLL